MYWKNPRICGDWRESAKCQHSETNYKVLEIKHVKIPFHLRTGARILRPLLDFTGITNRGDTYDHDAIFVDL